MLGFYFESSIGTLCCCGPVDYGLCSVDAMQRNLRTVVRKYSTYIEVLLGTSMYALMRRSAACVII